MSFDFAQAKANARKALHDGLSVLALYQDNVITTPQEIKVRYHSKTVIEGDPYMQGMTEVIEGSDKIVFDKTDTTYPLPDIKRGGQVSIPAYSLSFRLETKEPEDGPVIEVWRVARL